MTENASFQIPLKGQQPARMRLNQAAVIFAVTEAFVFLALCGVFLADFLHDLGEGNVVPRVLVHLAIATVAGVVVAWMQTRGAREWEIAGGRLILRGWRRLDGEHLVEDVLVKDISEDSRGLFAVLEGGAQVGLRFVGNERGEGEYVRDAYRRALLVEGA